jgi:hypothetical protein
MASPVIWGTIIASFCYMYFVYFCMTWRPAYFMERRQLSLGKMGLDTFFSFAGMATVATLAGWAADALIACDESVRIVANVAEVEMTSEKQVLAGPMRTRNPATRVSRMSRAQHRQTPRRFSRVIGLDRRFQAISWGVHRAFSRRQPVGSCIGNRTPLQPGNKVQRRSVVSKILIA